MGRTKIRRILVATDFSAYSRESLTYAVYLAKCLGAELLLVHVFERPVYSDVGVAHSVRSGVQRWLREVKSETTAKLTALVRQLRQQWADTHPLWREGTPSDEIVQCAKETSSDMVVLGTHGRTGLAHVLLGSVTERVLRHAPCPVLTVRPRALHPRRKAR